MRTLIRLCLLIVAAFICSIIFSTPQRAFAQANCTVCITEFRTRGGGGATDEYVEIYNNTAGSIDISGYKLNSSSSGGTINTRGTVPASTTLSSGQHYLFVTTSYTLAAVAAGDPLVAAWTVGIADDGGAAILTSTNVILDQVGMDIGSAYKEGTVLVPMAAGSTAAPAASNEFAFVRKTNLITNKPQDTGVNADDFVKVVADTAAKITTKYSTQVLTLGAPGPENTASPIESTALFTTALYDTSKTAAQSPNRCYDSAATGGTVGALYIRRNITNNSAPTTQLLFRVVDITTASNPAPPLAQAIIKPMTVDPATDTTTCPRPLTLQGTTLTAPSIAANGGLNSALSTTPIAASSNANVEYKLAADRTGSFRFLLIYEAK